MAECLHFEHLLVLPRLRVQNANAISSPLTHGFPSMTAFLGLMWALERKTQAAGLDLQFNAVSAVVHNHQELVTDGGFIHSLRLTRNPLDKDGGSAAIVEEGRIHLDISLVFAVQSQALLDAQAAPAIAAQVGDLLAAMRIAGGTVVQSPVPRGRRLPYVMSLTGDAESREKLFGQLTLRLLPGFALVERSDLLAQRHAALQAQHPGATRLDAWLSLSRINWHWQEEGDGGQWRHDRQNLGWIVPIPLGYGALGELQPAGSVANARDWGTPFRFVESLYGIGQWLSPHRLYSPQQLLWYADSHLQDGLYRCRNDYRQTPVHDFDFA
ncbi:type I-F CRISPR-associated protein Csy2 [Pseudothauera nasutitermitis]|uniref:Type I-F CRISPR-associated protein Csy2 n=1 Tax=Pseudothauera nasutitermitis TaxID=2565930 RepID=A0A4S4AW69_9RHOO|nr:type I-F CRISPR-associated protein Csy2 [Pseudothauera nasutitermitis]THF62838.1 type I-F CRISPR-associated protein Csy2 [Pseudothauera nasutitermitis]